MSCSCNHCSDCHQRVLKEFDRHEIKTVGELLRCAEGVPTNSNFARILLLALRGHWASSLNLDDAMKHMACYTWSDNAEGSPRGTLQIEPMHEFDDEKPESFPGIYIGLGGVDLQKLAMGNHHSTSPSGATTTMVKGARLVLEAHHVATKENDAYDLAESSNTFLTAIAPVLSKATGAYSIESKGYATAKKAGNSPTRYYDVVLSLEIFYTVAVALSIESHRLRRISYLLAATSGAT